MSEPYVGEIRMFAGNFAPKGWAFCNGQTFLISQGPYLFSILGFNYGGNGTTTFALPNLQGGVPIHWGQGPGLAEYLPGQIGGQPKVTLTTAEMAAHTHAPAASGAAGTETAPAMAYWAQSSARDRQYGTGDPDTQMADVLGLVGDGTAHENMAPYLGVNYIIALIGVAPPQP